MRWSFSVKTSSFRTPNFLLPGCLQNHGNYIVSLGSVTRWMAEQAEALSVEIFPGFAAAEVLFNEDGSVKGVATGNMGVGKDGNPGDSFQLGMELHAKYTVFAEGARGHLGKQLIARFKLDADSDPQTYGLGIKELWEIDPQRHEPGFVLHTAGWPMDNDTYGGAFLYHFDDNKVALGFITGLDYANPYLSPFEEMQRWKTHPNIAYYLAGDDVQGHQAGQAPGIRRARHHGRWPAQPAQDGIPRRRAGRLRRRLPECEPHQGQPCGHQDRHAGCAGCFRRDWRRTPA